MTPAAEIAWRGEDPASVGMPLAVVPARAETQLWTFALGPAERYEAQPDPAGRHELLLVIAGTLLLEKGGKDTVSFTEGQHVAFSNAQPYACANASRTEVLRNARIVVN